MQFVYIMYRLCIQVFAILDIALSCFRFGLATFQLAQREDHKVIQVLPQRDSFFENFYDEDDPKFFLQGALYYILQILTFSLGIFLLLTVSDQTVGWRQTKRIHMWTVGFSLVIIVYIIYLIRRLYLWEDTLENENDDQLVWWLDIGEILFRFLFAIFVNKYITFMNPHPITDDSFNDIDPAVRDAFQKYVFQPNEPFI